MGAFSSPLVDLIAYGAFPLFIPDICAEQAETGDSGVVSRLLETGAQRSNAPVKTQITGEERDRRR